MLSKTFERTGCNLLGLVIARLNSPLQCIGLFVETLGPGVARFERFGYHHE